MEHEYLFEVTVHRETTKASYRDKYADAVSACRALLSLLSDEEREVERRLKDVVCPQCKQPFTLVWTDYSDRPTTLRLRGCPSGGIYSVGISCPHCDYEEEL